jgi:hypothetical protein
LLLCLYLEFNYYCKRRSDYLQASFVARLTLSRNEATFLSEGFLKRINDVVDQLVFAAVNDFKEIVCFFLFHSIYLNCLLTFVRHYFTEV